MYDETFSGGKSAGCAFSMPGLSARFEVWRLISLISRFVGIVALTLRECNGKIGELM